MNFSKKTAAFLLVVVVLLGFFLRTYHFDEYLLFRIDQERDYQIIKKAFDKGCGYLPLLGPKAGKPVHLKTDLPGESDSVNLGPIYYYFQYLAVWLFNNPAPWVLAVPDVFFSTLAIPLFYFLLRLKFSRWISFLGTLLLAFSFPLVEYSRFAWNTNQIIFWQLLLFFALLKVHLAEKERFRRVFFLLIFLSLGVIIQLHFIAFFVFPVLVLFFWLIFGFPKKIGSRYWLLAGALFFLVCSPLIISDFANRGENFQRLVVTYFQEGTDFEQAVSFEKRIKKIFFHTGQMASHVLFSLNDNEVNKIELFSGLFFGLGILFLGFFCGKTFFLRVIFFKKNKTNKKNDQKILVRVLFLIFTGLIFLVYWKIFARLHNFRYWIFLAPVFFWIFVEGLAFLEKKFKTRGNFFLVMPAIFFLLFLHSTALGDFFLGLEKGKGESLWGRRLFLDDYEDLISWGMLQETAEKMLNLAEKDNKKPCFWVENFQQKSSFKTALERLSEKNITVADKLKQRDCAYFLITEKRKGGAIFPKKMKSLFISQNFFLEKSLVLWKVTPLKDEDNYVMLEMMDSLLAKNAEKIAKEQQKASKQVLIWNDLWEK